MAAEGAAATIREARASDADRLAAIYAPHVTGAVTSFELVAPDGAEFARRMAAADDHFAWLVCERDGEVVGYAYASAHRGRAAYKWAAEVSVYIHEDSRRANVARGLYVALLEIVRMQERCVALAGITLPNPASEGFHEALGFVRCATYHNIGHKFGAWHDVGWWELMLGELPDTPVEPIALSDVRDTPAFAAALRAGEALLAR
ncbi:MAG: GNAT family N-acetyltransferase [Planctomycetota bacterium]|jgi:phosphinothricin acetyltransferase